jgi:glycosyltransferase involved in cell wall biosynthesis
LIRTDDLLLADSKFTAEQIMMYKDNLKVEVLHCKIPSPEDFECLDCVKCRIYQLPEIFVLCVNTIEPRKNYGNLLKAWERSSHADSTAKLLIIGRRGWKCGELIQKIRATRNVVWIDDACDGLVGKAYQGAQFVINPSYAEGFNFPTLEAKVFERPCYASDIPVNQELHCDIAKFNPYDVDEITTTINRGFLDSKLNYNPITANTDKFYNDLRNILIENRII